MERQNFSRGNFCLAASRCLSRPSGYWFRARGQKSYRNVQNSPNRRFGANPEKSDLEDLFGQKRCRTKSPRMFRIFDPNFAPNFASNFPRIFEDFSCFVSWETKTTKNSRKKITRQQRNCRFRKTPRTEGRHKVQVCLSRCAKS